MVLTEPEPCTPHRRKPGSRHSPVFGVYTDSLWRSCGSVWTTEVYPLVDAFGCLR